MTKEAAHEWSQENVQAVLAPFDQHFTDQFHQTLTARGYPCKTAAELDQCMRTGVALYEKVASGQVQAPARQPTMLEALNNKVASALDLHGEAERNDQLIQLQQKVAATVDDPFVLYAAAALQSME